MLRIKVKKSLYVQVLCAALSDVLKLNVEGPAASVLRGLHLSPQFLSARFVIGGIVRGPETCVRV